MSDALHIEAGDRAALRRFGLTLAFAVPLFFWLILPFVFAYQRPSWPLWAAASLASVAVLFPRAMYPVYRLWLPLAMAIGWINTRIILGVVFFFLLAPFGWLLRSIGKLQFDEAIDKKRVSYRVVRDGADRRGDLARPF